MNSINVFFTNLRISSKDIFIAKKPNLSFVINRWSLSCVTYSIGESYTIALSHSLTRTINPSVGDYSFIVNDFILFKLFFRSCNDSSSSPIPPPVFDSDESDVASQQSTDSSYLASQFNQHTRLSFSPKLTINNSCNQVLPPSSTFLMIQHVVVNNHLNKILFLMIQ